MEKLNRCLHSLSCFNSLLHIYIYILLFDLFLKSSNFLNPAGAVCQNKHNDFFYVTLCKPILNVKSWSTPHLASVCNRSCLIPFFFAFSRAFRTIQKTSCGGGGGNLQPMEMENESFHVYILIYLLFEPAPTSWWISGRIHWILKYPLTLAGTSSSGGWPFFFAFSGSCQKRNRFVAAVIGCCIVNGRETESMPPLS